MSYLPTMYVYYIYTAILYIHKILKFTHKKSKTTFDFLLDFPFRCLRRVRTVAMALRSTEETGYQETLYVHIYM